MRSAVLLVACLLAAWPAVAASGPGHDADQGGAPSGHPDQGPPDHASDDGHAQNGSVGHQDPHGDAGQTPAAGQGSDHSRASNADADAPNGSAGGHAREAPPQATEGRMDAPAGNASGTHGPDGGPPHPEVALSAAVAPRLPGASDAVVHAPVGPEAAPPGPVGDEGSGGVADDLQGGSGVQVPDHGPDLTSTARGPVGEALLAILTFVVTSAGLGILGTVQAFRRSGSKLPRGTKAERHEARRLAKQAADVGLDEWSWSRPETFDGLRAIDSETVAFWTGSDAADVARWQGKGGSKDEGEKTAPTVLASAPRGEAAAEA